ncbi:MAG: polyprenyl synthetase family protein [Marmoricola sp.]
MDAPLDPQALARACASLELLHASALVHDDYMDASDTCRGRPSAHRAFENSTAPMAGRHRQSNTAHPQQSCWATCC